MQITILNGNPASSEFDGYLAELKSKLEARNHTVSQLNLREVDFSYCIGCFGCWVKTPGVCSSRDQSCAVRRAVIQSDFTLWAAPLVMGFPSALLKKALDKSIPLIHPYMVVDQGEAHHRPRYEHYPRLGLLVGRELDTDGEDLEIVADIFSRTALNFKSRLEFSFSTETPVEDILRCILDGSHSYPPIKKKLKPIFGVSVAPPKNLTIFNGSPRGNRGNTPIMLRQFGEGFSSVAGHNYTIHNLNRLKEHKKFSNIFSASDCVWLGFPLYTDSMPGMVKAFFETLEPLQERSHNPPIGFLVQSGFPEAHHSRYVERYLEKLAARLNAPYAGTIVKGGGEGVRMMPQERTAELFKCLQAIGRGFAERGILSADLLSDVAGVERYHPLLGPVFKLFLRTSAASWYWDSQLKQNGVYEERFARPYSSKDFAPVPKTRDSVQ